MLYLYALSILFACNNSVELFSELAQQEQTSSGSQPVPLSTVLNADSVYSTSYSALCLNLQLGTSGFYQTGDKALISMTEVIYLLEVVVNIIVHLISLYFSFLQTK